LVVAGLEKGRKLIVRGKLLRAKVPATVPENTLVLLSENGTLTTLRPGEILTIVEPPLVLSGPSVMWHLMNAESVVGFITTSPDNLVLAAATGDDDDVGEVVTIEKTAGDPTTLTFSSPFPNVPPLRNKYDRATVSIYANVALATHGETVQEVLGGGDPTEPYQQFTLRQSPMTYVSAPNPSGADSSLRVRVNDLLWHEVQSLYWEGPRDRVFVTRRSDDGKTIIEFGDGLTGTRLPAGRDNVRVAYRKGIGVDGMVKAGQLTTLLTRPLGVKTVTNPVAASGAGNPESLDDARTNAPLKVLTLERVVSLEDYQDFARAFSGIAKALATWTWNGQTQGVFLTVAGPNGAPVDAGSELYTNLLGAMQAAGDPFVPLQVESYRSVPFRLAAQVKIDPDYEAAKVLAAVLQSLRDTFSFAARSFGQQVALSEVIATVQAVEGVLAVIANRLYREGDPTVLNDRLLAALPVAGSSGNLSAAELLTLDPAPLDALGEMT
jgi:predicted phage baseplate assembly protein